MRKIFRTRKPITIRFSLLRSFMLLILVSSLTVLLLTTIRAYRTENELSEKLITEGTQQATQELDRFFQPVNKNTLLAARWGLAGKLNLAGVVGGPPGKITKKQLQAAFRINSLLLPIMQLFPEMSSLQVANARGDGFLIIRLEGGRIRNRVVSRERWGTQTLWFDLDEQSRPQSPEWKEVDYEPRKRAWYVGLKDLSAGEIFWTEPYIFFTTKDLGITASVKWNEGGLEYVFAVDILLKSITEFTQRESNQLSKNSQTAVYTKTWKAVGLPRHQRFRDPESIRLALLCSVEELQIPELRAAVKEGETNKAVGKALEKSGKAIFSYDSGGETWWAGVTAYPLGKRRHLWIGILVPNYDLLEGISQLRLYLLAATAVALLAALAYSFLLARSYSRPLEALAIQSRRIGDLDFHTDAKIEAKLHEFKQLEEAQAQALAALQSFSRYVPLEVVKELVGKGEVARIGGRTEILTILFSDIANFTHISETMSPEALTNHMAEYFQNMIDTLHRHAATVDKMVGDAIVAFWGAPTPIPDQADQAVHAVLEAMSLLETLNDGWRARGLPALPTRFGLATGPVVVGNIGARTRLAYTVLGDIVNLASRLEGLNKVYGTTFLVDAATREACSKGYAWRHLDRIIVAGRTEPTDIFQVLGVEGMVPEKILAAAANYEAAWGKYRAGDFSGALAMLDGFEPEFGPDLAAQRLRKLCEKYRHHPPADGWDGISRMTSK
ncbi:MAG: adenylate/guanylate cyclase domain-containing protein [Syntrophales bacterium]|nr:adenylate/guanylate cyclase domain-containing protein [Syntrophales bacterium]MDD5643656.1 adenylate/guanylate cyclase domain-containing protein [Syntrophales bacterium]